MWNTCKYPECEKWSRRKDGDYCSSHERAISNAEESDQKANQKRSQLIENQKIKGSQPRPKPKPISDKRKAEMEIYSENRKQFLLNKWCAYHGQGCIPTTVHHAKGRIGSLYLDERYWVPLCMEAHEWVEKNPNEAKDKELSFSRLAVNQEKTVI